MTEMGNNPRYQGNARGARSVRRDVRDRRWALVNDNRARGINYARGAVGHA